MFVVEILLPSLSLSLQCRTPVGTAFSAGVQQPEFASSSACGTVKENWTMRQGQLSIPPYGFGHHTSLKGQFMGNEASQNLRTGR